MSTLIVVEDSMVFACYSKACAPPPAGRGGSLKGKGGGGSVGAALSKAKKSVAADKNPTGGVGGGGAGKKSVGTNPVNKRLPAAGSVGDKPLRKKIIAQAQKNFGSGKAVALDPASKAQARALLREHDRLNTALNKSKSRKKDEELDNAIFDLWDKAGFTQGAPAHLADIVRKSLA